MTASYNVISPTMVYEHTWQNTHGNTLSAWVVSGKISLRTCCLNCALKDAETVTRWRLRRVFLAKGKNRSKAGRPEVHGCVNTAKLRVAVRSVLKARCIVTLGQGGERFEQHYL